MEVLAQRLEAEVQEITTRAYSKAGNTQDADDITADDLDEEV